MLKSLFNNTVSDISIISILICSLVSILLGVVIAYTHKKTSDYSKNFLITLVILPVLVQIVMIVVNGNLGTSVAIVGAFSLVRFRSIPGTSKEILSIFFAMSIGLATGMGHILFAIIMTILVAIAILLFSKLKIFEVDSSIKVLRIVVPEDLDYTDMFQDILKEYTTNHKLQKVKTINMGSLFELNYKITLKKDINEKEFIDKLRILNGNLKIILSSQHDISEI